MGVCFHKNLEIRARVLHDTQTEFYFWFCCFNHKSPLCLCRVDLDRLVILPAEDTSRGQFHVRPILDSLLLIALNLLTDCG